MVLFSTRPARTTPPSTNIPLLLSRNHSLVPTLPVTSTRNLPQISLAAAMGKHFFFPSLETRRTSRMTKQQALSIDTPFTFPSPIPSWPSGGGFAKGTIEIGGLELCQVSTFTKIWVAQEGGPDNLGATFFTPSQLPNGFYSLGCYAQPNGKPLFGWVLAGKDLSGDSLRSPEDYSLVWSSESSRIKKDGNGYFWLPTAPKGYEAVGYVITNSPAKPSVEAIRCVREDLTDRCENDTWIWSSSDGSTNVYSSRPATRGVAALGLSTGTFVAQPGSASSLPSLSCLKNKNPNYTTAMPNLNQIQALVKSYSPWIYFHPDEPYLPSSVSWFFTNGALLYKKDSPTPLPIAADGSNLPQGGSNDGSYWLDLPVNDSDKEKVKKGDLASTAVHLHIKPMLGGTFTDIAIWVFYPFNGPATAKVDFIKHVSLGRIGEHVGDWEHVTLRISNFNGELKRVYFAEHSRGTWKDASELEYQAGNKPVTYASLHGHAFYPKSGLVLQGNTKLGIGIRNDTDKGQSVDTGSVAVVVAAEHLGSAVVEPPWLLYGEEWGPKIDYNISDELRKLKKLLPWKLKKVFENVINDLPNEVLGEEGPTGPKMKSNWSNDEV